jgi:hypothetical protein
VLGFTMTTLHMAPLSRNFLFGAWQPEPTSKMVFGLAPDRQWLGFCYAMTHGGSLASGYATKDPDVYGFDSRGDFVLRYGYRRAAFALPLEKGSRKD